MSRTTRFLAILGPPSAEVGTLPTTHMADHVTGDAPREVVFINFDPAPDLSAALRRAEALAGIVCFQGRYPDLVTGSAAAKMLVVSYKLRKRTMLVLVGLSLVVSAAVGTVIGVLSASVSAGFACFGGLGLVISVLLAVVFWTGN